jgi:hypothetical protein
MRTTTAILRVGVVAPLVAAVLGADVGVIGLGLNVSG